MASQDLIVKPSYILTENDILTVEKLNLMATPVVELALQDPVNDQNYLRNGNFYSSFWTNPAGVTCPAGVWTSNADYWATRPLDAVVHTTLSADFVQPAVNATVSATVTTGTNTTLSAGFTQPAASATVPITVASTIGFVAAQSISIAVGGVYTVSSVTDATHMVVTNTGVAGNAAPAASVPTGGTVRRSATQWMTTTQALWVEHGGAYTVSSVTDNFNVVLKNVGGTENAAPGATVSTGSSVSPQNTAVITLRSSAVPDTASLFSAEVQGNTAAGSVEFGQQISGDLSATLRKVCTFSGYIYNFTGLTVSPKLRIYTCDAFNNFNLITLQSTVDLQTCASGLWTYVTVTVDYALVANMSNGLLLAVYFTSGLNSSSNYVLFSRLKFQIGSIATPFTDDVAIFVTTPSIDSTMLQDGCIARPSLFMPKVIPVGTYIDKSIKNGDIDDGAINARTLAAGVAVGNLGYTPINKAGDSGIGPGALSFNNDDVVGVGSVSGGAAFIQVSSANATNDGYMPAISFWRPGLTGRALGLSTTGRMRVVDHVGTVGYLLDSVFKVATADVQDKAITFAKLADSLVALLIAPGTVHQFAGPSPPAGWLICDGTSYLTSTYPALYAAIGIYWGNGGDATGNHFQVPNFVNRTPIGYGAGGYWAFAKQDLGEVNHTLVTDELPSHAHSITDQQHNHSVNAHHHSYVNPIGTSLGTYAGGVSATQASGVTNTSDTASTMNPSYSNITATNAAGLNGGHNNMQPSAVLYFVIKT